jgi:hypothetical protein
MNCDCQHEGVCKHRLNIGVALDPILVKYFGGFEVNKDVWDFISSKCRFKQSKAAPVQQTTNARADICPHYFEATDGVHVVVVGRCRCAGKLPAA